MPRKQSLLYDNMNVMLCNNAHLGYMCDRCEYTIRDENLLRKLPFRDLTLIIESLLICEKDQNVGIDPRSIIISCRGAITYKSVHINSNIKLSTNAELFKCILDMWMSICPFAISIGPIVMSYKRSITNCVNYQNLSNNIRFISQHFTAWSTGSMYIETRNSNNSYAA